MEFLTALLNFILSALIAAVVLIIVDRLNVGLKVGSYGNAVIAAIVIAAVSWILTWLLGLLGITIAAGGNLLGAIALLIFSAVVLLLSSKVLPTLKVAGFRGAIIAAIAIAVVGWIGSWILSLLGIG